MKIIKNKLQQQLNIRTEQDYPIKGIEFIDIMPLILQADVYQEIIDKIKEEIGKKEIDYIVAPEARGFLIGSVIAKEMKKGCVPVRKKEKLPPTTIECEFEYEKEYGKDKLCLPKLVNESYKDKKFYIVDDIYATGNTIRAIKKAVQDLGGVVQGVAVIMNIKELNADKDVFSLLEVEEEKK